MKNIYLFELSDVFANQVYLPYSSGVVWSYIKNNPIIKKNYQLKDWFFARDNASNIINKIENPSVLLFSCFMWNWNLNCEIAKVIKEKYPNCLIIYGGQHQPLSDRNKGFFKKYPYIDILIHGEGEETVEKILLKSDNLKEIIGITLNLNNKEFITPSRKRLDEIKDCPSPFLDGSFDWIIKKNKEDKNYSFHATVESARGCPFSCAFCEIGEQYYQKIKTSYEKTKREIDWLAKNKIEYITDANSNFGIMFGPDYDLAKYVVEVKKKYGYPKAFRVTWAKGQADKVLQIAKLFEEAGVQKGMTIALQSMNKKVLTAIQRKNVDGGKLREFIQTYEKENISSYVELIWGLPEETLESFINGVTYIMEEGYHNYLDIHLMMLLPNAPISEPGYKERYGLKTMKAQPRFSHRSNPEQLVDDTVEFVTEANSFTKEDWIEGHQFRWLIIFGHYLGSLQFIARGLKKIYSIGYKEFYTKLLVEAQENSKTYLGKEYLNIRNNLDEILKNKRHWGDVIKEAGDINWEVDEASCIRLTKNKDTFYKELKDYLIQEYAFIDMNVLDTLFKYQLCRLHNPFKKYPFSKGFKYNIHDVIELDKKLEKKNNKLLFNGKNFNSNLYEWAKETLWFGRRIARYKTRVTVL
jgi:putative methyltransferase|tara:strand:+ start:84 stop:1997 length:1914 start_codon:yes stop_codon:yes gene_type:complete